MLRAMSSAVGAAVRAEVEMWRAAANTVGLLMGEAPPHDPRCWQPALVGDAAPIETGAGSADPEGDVLEWDGLLLAVPKRRTSHSKKRMRMVNKYLKPLENVTTCTACGGARLMHHLCLRCVSRAQNTVRNARRRAALMDEDEADGAEVDAQQAGVLDSPKEKAR